jgi:ABC-type Fe3+/spermidine/putrescine transport system ATPase subunit
MSDRICVMNQGAIEQIGPPDQVYYRPQSHFVATFFGDNNLLPGTVGSVYRIGLLPTYEYRFQLCGSAGFGMIVSGWIKWLI